MFGKLTKKDLFYLVLVLLIASIIKPDIGSSNVFSVNIVNIDETNINSSLEMDGINYLSIDSASPGDSVTVYGNGFGDSSGYVVLTGLHIEATSWSDTEIIFDVPRNSASGYIYIRDSEDNKSNSVNFTVKRDLLDGQLEPYGLNIEETGLFGSAFLVETDGAYLYGITGFETLCTYKIFENIPYELCSRITLPQRAGDLKLYNGYLFCPGDHGLFIYRCSDLQQGSTDPIASIAGGSYLTLDIKEKTGQPIDGTMLALCEYLPTADPQVLHVPLYKFESEELTLLGTFSRTVLSTERQHALAIDPLSPKVYVSGFETLNDDNAYILEISISDLSAPFLNHREETGEMLAFDMDAKKDLLWAGVLLTGTEIFRTYTLKSGIEHLALNQIIEGGFGFGQATRVKIIDDNITVGSRWLGARPDVFLLDTFNSGTSPLASADSLDWAFDVTGYAKQTGEYDGKIIVADEWGGFLTYEYTHNVNESITHKQDYQWTPSSAMIENLYLTDNRVYAANRGAGIWSADRFDVSDESLWKHSEWDWTLQEPQPHPISALCVREDTVYGTLIAARGNDKAFAWGDKIYGILYQETSTGIQKLAISEEIDPSGGFLSGSPGFCVLWPETDLVYMATGTDGFRAFIVNPEEPGISLHKDCLLEGFGINTFAANKSVSDLYYYKTGSEQKIIIGSTVSPFANESSITIIDVTYPDGIPDRDHPDRDIQITLEDDLQCLKGKSITYFDVSSSGMIAAASNYGLAVFHISWISELNKMSNTQAWDLIKIPEDACVPWWDDSWSASYNDVSFGDEKTIYAVKTPQGKKSGGVWCLDIEIDEDELTHNSVAKGYYPGVQCGMDYTYLLPGWGNSDITTIHHPYGLVADGDTVYVTGWSGKIDRLTFNVDNNPPATPDINGSANGEAGTSYSYTFSSTDPEGDDVFYYIEWGDGLAEEWIGPHSSGNETTVDHTWSKQGTFTIKAKARDSRGGTSDWESLEITIAASGNGCPAALIVNYDPEKTGLLRDFRDSILMKTPEGRKWVRSFYKHSSELIFLLMNNKQIRDASEQALSSILLYLPAADVCNIPVPQTLKKDLNSLCDLIGQEAGSELNDTINQFKKRFL